MSVWISDEKLLIFASLISPSKMILFEKKYQTFDTVFHHQMKHLEVRQKYSATRPFFSTLFSVFYLVMKHCVSCLIYYMKQPFRGTIVAEFLQKRLPGKLVLLYSELAARTQGHIVGTENPAENYLLFLFNFNWQLTFHPPKRSFLSI